MFAGLVARNVARHLLHIAARQPSLCTYAIFGHCEFRNATKIELHVLLPSFTPPSSLLQSYFHSKLSREAYTFFPLRCINVHIQVASA